MDEDTGGTEPITGPDAQMQSNTRWELNAEEEHDKLFEMWTGHAWDEDNNKYVKITNITATMTIEGAEHLLQYAKTIDHKIFFLSTFSAYEIRKAMFEIHWLIVQEIADFYKQYKIHKDDRHKVVKQLFFYAWACFNKPKDDGERKHRRSIHKSQEVTHRMENNSPEQNKRKWF